MVMHRFLLLFPFIVALLGVAAHWMNHSRYSARAFSVPSPSSRSSHLYVMRRTLSQQLYHATAFFHAPLCSLGLVLVKPIKVIWSYIIFGTNTKLQPCSALNSVRLTALIMPAQPSRERYLAKADGDLSTSLQFSSWSCTREWLTTSSHRKR